MQTYGKGDFRISFSNPTGALLGTGYDYELDLSDRETVTVSETALDGTRHTTVKGEYINPKIRIIYPANIAELQALFNAHKGQVVTLRPYDDNAAFEFPCTLVAAYPEDDGGAELQNFIIELESTGYVTRTGVI